MTDTHGDSLDALPPAVRALVVHARGAQANAWAPYSRFAVGAVLEALDGTTYSGCNVENASFPAGICAERGALAAAVAAGVRAFARVVIVSDATEPAPPCGVCRQALVEFAPALEVVSVTVSGRWAQWSLATLLPSPFHPASLTVL
jgi:cytidine deaminase